MNFNRLPLGTLVALKAGVEGGKSNEEIDY
jgi:hypothetical protein